MPSKGEGIMTILVSEHLPMVSSHNPSWLLVLHHRLCLQITQPLLVQVATSWDNTPSITLLMEIPELCPRPRPLPLVQGAFTLPLPMPNLSEIRVSLYIYTYLNRCQIYMDRIS